VYRFLDDQALPFKPNPHFIQWLPLLRHPEACLLFRPGKKPQVLVYQPDDFWHAPPALPVAPWSDHFEVRIFSDLEGLSSELSALQAHAAWIGEPAQWRHRVDERFINPANLLNELHYHRPLKTDFEIECIRRANQLAVPAHRAAEKKFREGGSEHDILLAFLAACRQTENELPYPAIVATNAHGAILHYQHYGQRPGAPYSLLIDAGCSFAGYPSDITRTHVHEDVGFAAMVEDLDESQRALCDAVRPGVAFADLHHAAHQAVAARLDGWGLVRGDIEELIDKGITALFFPHGLGHFLGLQVHDVGGTFANTTGAEIERPERYPHLRLRRTLEPGQVLTIEPGIYFIDSLLERLKTVKFSGSVDWPRIESLKRFGGIRIEDNLVVTHDGAENLTRQAFSANEAA
jgi:Xaa-Pro dipeptidase